MKRLLTAGIFGTILGIVGAGTANASIVSSGFLDEKLTEYALSTSLDLKANQSDLTALSNKIGTLPDGRTLGNFYNEWVDSGGGAMAKYIATQGGNGMVSTYDPVRDDFGPSRFPDLGYLGVLARLINGEGIGSIEDTTTLAPFWYLTKQAMRVGEIPHGKTAAGMIDEINTKIGTLPDGKNLAGMIGETDTKIGTLPSGITVQGMLNGWTDGPYTLPGLFSLSIDAMKFEDFYGERVGSILSYGLDEFTSQEYTGPIYPLWKLSQGIGTLPSGNFLDFPGSESLFPGINQPFTYPTSLAELITAIYGDGEPGRAGLLAGIIAGVPLYGTDGNGGLDEYLGIIPNRNLAINAKDLADANATKIGTVPDGKNLAGMISETDAKIGTVPDGKNLAGMIGTLPAGYDSVGAALSAIKGIAEDAKAAALAAIPDPKQEGSSGKYVLTVDIVGDNATYHWEKIDREGETTSTE